MSEAVSSQRKTNEIKQNETGDLTVSNGSIELEYTTTTTSTTTSTTTTKTTTTTTNTNTKYTTHSNVGTITNYPPNSTQSADIDLSTSEGGTMTYVRAKNTATASKDFSGRLYQQITVKALSGGGGTYDTDNSTVTRSFRQDTVNSATALAPGLSDNTGAGGSFYHKATPTNDDTFTESASTQNTSVALNNDAVTTITANNGVQEFRNITTKQYLKGTFSGGGGTAKAIFQRRTSDAGIQEYTKVRTVSRNGSGTDVTSISTANYDWNHTKAAVDVTLTDTSGSPTANLYGTITGTYPSGEVTEMVMKATAIAIEEYTTTTTNQNQNTVTNTNTNTYTNTNQRTTTATFI